MHFFKTFISVALLLFSGFSAWAEELGIDYHVHIQSPEMGKLLGQFCGTLAKCKAEDLKDGSTIESLLPTLENSRFNRAVIMSVGYMGGMPEFKMDNQAQKNLTRNENKYIADQVAQSEKLFGFFSVNPLADYALDEARYWMKSGGHDGLKLHFANSAVDLLNPDHVANIQALFEVVDKDEMTIMIHLRTRNPEYGAKDVAVFINDLLPHVSKAKIIIGHGAGWGGYDEATDQALDAFIEGFKDGSIDPSRVYMGVGAVIMPGLPQERTDIFLKKFRSIKKENWIFGSDWSPGLSPLDPVSYLATLREAGLTDEEAQKLISNQLPFVK